MSPIALLGFVLGYVLLLLLVAWRTSRHADNASFFIGNRRSHRGLVAFGRVGTSLSGVTFSSVPGTLAGSGFTYLQIVLCTDVGRGQVHRLDRHPADRLFPAVVLGHLPDRAQILFIIALISALCAVIDGQQSSWFGGYQIGLEMLLINAAITFAGLWLASAGRAQAPSAVATR